MRYPLTFDPHPQPADLDVLDEGISTFAMQQRELPPIESFGYFIRDEQNQLVGGCKGNYLYGCLYVDQLWVSESLRGQGYGTKLMQAALEYAKNKGCTFATVNTMDWEALPFYQQLGFEIEYVCKGFMKEAVCYFLRKNF